MYHSSNVHDSAQVCRCYRAFMPYKTRTTHATNQEKNLVQEGCKPPPLQPLPRLLPRGSSWDPTGTRERRHRPAVSRLELTLCLLGLGAESKPRFNRYKCISSKRRIEMTPPLPTKLEIELRQPCALTAAALIVDSWSCLAPAMEAGCCRRQRGSCSRCKCN